MLIRAIRDGDAITLSSDSWSKIDPSTLSVTFRPMPKHRGVMEAVIIAPPEVKAVHRRAKEAAKSS